MAIKEKDKRVYLLECYQPLGILRALILHFLLLLSSLCQIVQVLCGSVIIVPDYEDSDGDILGLIVR